jgi:hypothetical protein
VSSAAVDHWILLLQLLLMLLLLLVVVVVVVRAIVHVHVLVLLLRLVFPLIFFSSSRLKNVLDLPLFVDGAALEVEEGNIGRVAH